MNLKNTSKMTDKEVLQKAIEMAVKNGYKYFDLDDFYITRTIYPDYHQGYIHIDYIAKNQSATGVIIGVYNVIFSHDFAKSFWNGDGIVLISDGKTVESIKINDPLLEPLSWQYYLQQMVLEENPIDYLRRFIEK